MSADLEREHAELMEFLYQSPFALACVDAEGAVQVVNSHAATLVMEFSPTPSLDNLFDALDGVAPELRRMTRAFAEADGLICDGHRVEVDRPGEEPMVLSVTLKKLSARRIMVALADVSKLESVHRARRVVLENVSDGLVTVDLAGRLVGECSASLVAWLGRPPQGTTLSAYLGAHDAVFGEGLQIGWHMLQEGTLPMEVCLDQLPTRLEAGGVPLGFRYQAIVDHGRVSSVLVVARDLTPELENARLEAEQRELMAALSHLVRDRAEYRRFLGETTGLVARLSADQGALERVRTLHTLKGNTAMMGLTRFAALCHAAEEQVIEGGALPSGDAATLRERWEELAGRFLPLVGPEADITMTFAQHRELLLAVEEGASRGELRRKLELCAAQPVRSQLDAFAAHARALAERLGKTNVRVRVHADPGLRHDGRAFAGFWSAFIHAVRNVVDHGVDAPEARVAGNKSAEATIELAATSGAEGLTIELRDDGPGIDWSAVRHKAESLGAPASTDADLVAALFLDGLSTREVVSEVSGRGAGMGALRSACESLAGAVEVEGRPGAGTTLRFRFPPPPPGPISAGPRDPASTPARAS